MKHWMREALVWAVRHQPTSLQSVGGVNVRVAAAKDMKAVHEMIVELAVFEKEPEVSRAVHTTLSSFLCSLKFDHHRFLAGRQDHRRYTATRWIWTMVRHE